MQAFERSGVEMHTASMEGSARILRKSVSAGWRTSQNRHDLKARDFRGIPDIRAPIRPAPMNATFTLSLAPLMVSAAQPATFRKSRRRVETWAMPSVVTGFIAYTDVDEDFYRIPSPGSRQSALEPAGRTPRRAAASARGALHCRRSGGDSPDPAAGRRIRDEDTFRRQDTERLERQSRLVVGGGWRHRRKVSGRVPTSFLFTKDNYTDFRLTVSSKMVDSENHAGVCFWGEVIEEGTNKWNTRGPLGDLPIPACGTYPSQSAARVLF